MKAVILCGGQGTRIRDANESLPKPMLPIGGKPIVWHIMKMYAAHGITEFVLCLGYKSWVIKEFFLNYRAMTNDLTVTLGKNHAVEISGTADENWKVILAETGEDTMTGGRVAAIRKYVENDELFCLTYGDGVSDVDITKLLAFHRGHGQVASVTAVRPPGRFGEMRLDGDAVAEFNEKPQTTEGFINGGFFVCDSKRIWDFIPNQKKLTLEQEPMRKLSDANQLSAFRHTGFWQPMDTLREFTLLNDLWASGKAPWKSWKDGP
ncbi:MAG: glucose-1-phosphate cytidylyltransferase [Archangium sp.]|nr:glucose-1-phosphate cytidylyltransferase [Archangium sp.]